MAGLFDLSSWWGVLLVITVGTSVLNLVLTLIGKRRAWQMLQFLSLSGGILMMLAEYQFVNRWVNAGDWSAIEDVVPGMTEYLSIGVFVVLALNAVVLILNSPKKKT